MVTLWYITILAKGERLPKKFKLKLVNKVLRVSTGSLLHIFSIRNDLPVLTLGPLVLW